VAAAAERQSFPAGKRIIERGELGDSFYIVLSGRVQVTRGGEVLATLADREFFGEGGALNARPGYSLARDATVEAETHVAAAVIPVEQFAGLVASAGGFRDLVYETMRRRQPG
jgi:CRP-like cAMP-binding protein